MAHQCEVTLSLLPANQIKALPLCLEKFPNIMDKDFKGVNLIKKLLSGGRVVNTSTDTDRVVAVNLTIAIKHCGYFALLPENLDLEAHLEMYPLTNFKFRQISDKIISYNDNGTFGSNFDIEGLIHILDLLNIIPARNKDLITEDGFVPINSTKIRNYLRDYECYLDYLIKTDILVPDNHYIVGEKSRGYKFAPAYENSRLVQYNYRRFISQQPQTVSELNQRFENNTLVNYSYLTHWYYHMQLAIDKEAAEDYALALMQKKFRLGYNSWDKNRDKWSNKRNDYCRKNPRTQYWAVMRNINHIDRGDYKAMIDTNIHRLHSVITNMQKDFRNFLSCDGQQLVSIDIKNSQPYLSCILFNPDFWDVNSTLYLRLNQLPDNIKNSIIFTPPSRGAVSILDSLTEFFNGLNGYEFDLFRNIVSAGRLYETIKEWIQEERGETIPRSDVKTIIFKLFFAPNRVDSNDDNHYDGKDFCLKFNELTIKNKEL